LIRGYPDQEQHEGSMHSKLGLKEASDWKRKTQRFDLLNVHAVTSLLSPRLNPPKNKLKTKG
jgi:hypothetical protein